MGSRPTPHSHRAWLAPSPVRLSGGCCLLLLATLLLQRRLRCCQPCHRNAVRAARDVIEAAGLEEIDALRIAAVLATNAELDPRARLAPQLAGDADQLADTAGVQAVKRV